MKMDEHEIKILLTKREYNFLVSAMGLPKKHDIQTNYYYDTDDFSMNKSGITYRIREKQGKYTATMKHHLSASHSVETSTPVQGKYDKSQFPSCLLCQGCLITDRKAFGLLSGVDVMLDKNTYLDIVDYELEIEYAFDKKRDAEEVLIYFANALYDRWIVEDAMMFYLRAKDPKRKSARFFERKYLLNTGG